MQTTSGVNKKINHFLHKTILNYVIDTGDAKLNEVYNDAKKVSYILQRHY